MSETIFITQLSFLIEKLNEHKISEIIDLSDAWDKLENITEKQKRYIYYLMNKPSKRSSLINFLNDLGLKNK